MKTGTGRDRMASRGLRRFAWAATGVAALSSAALAQDDPLTSAVGTECVATGETSPEQPVILPTTGQAFTLPPVEGEAAAPCPELPPLPVRPAPPNIFGTVALPVKSTSMSLRWDAARQVDPETMPMAPREIAAQAGAMPGRQKLAFLNTWVNNNIAFTEDGDRDHWASAVETFSLGRGDCEDFAIAKLALLLAAGASSDDLFMVIVRDTVRGRDHAVLAARLDGEMLVLDSRTDLLLPSGAITDYRPMFSFEGPFTWMHGYKAGPVPIAGN